MRKTLFVTIMVLLVSTHSNAQSFEDIFNFSHTSFSEVDNNLFGSNIKSNKLNLTKFYLAGPPIELGKLRIIYNAEYKWYQNDFTSRNNQELLFAKDLHDVRLATIFNYKLSNKWALNYVNFSSVKSDFKNFNFSNAYKGVNAVTVGFSPKGDDNFRYGLGVTYSKDMGDALILPVAFIYYKTDKWLIDLMYPRLNVFHRFTKKIEAGFMVNYDIGAFDVEFDSNLISSMPVKPAYQTTNVLAFTPQINYYLSNELNIYARAGINLISETGLTDADYNEIENIGYESEKMGVAFGVGLTYKIPHGKKE
ncbi:DUF6268 family outer membrane beta-barrel protein [Flavobacterium sp. J27]|uniref:DUF6268 family outer membrane beta-barrel protein n=1 Tax=Flavobacterium sp. J27 TaxID=2060419 RepID=UPI0010320039|nr:DUF6268 family outer membrane beta-barrel protein [Flavobacterium sp. J27]